MFCAYVLYGVKYIDPVPLTRYSGRHEKHDQQLLLEQLVATVAWAKKASLHGNADIRIYAHLRALCSNAMFTRNVGLANKGGAGTAHTGMVVLETKAPTGRARLGTALAEASTHDAALGQGSAVDPWTNNLNAQTELFLAADGGWPLI